MPADLMEKSSASPVAATPASINATPDKPKTAAEHRKVRAGCAAVRRAGPGRALTAASLAVLQTHHGEAAAAGA